MQANTQLLQNHTLPILHILEPHIFKLISPPATSPFPTHLLTPRLAQRILNSPHLPPKKPTYKPAALLDLVVCSHPVLGPQQLLRQDPILRSEIQLLGRGDADVVQPVQESENFQLRICFCDRGQGGVWDAVGRVEDGFSGLAAGRGETPFQTVAVDGEAGPRLARGGGEERVCCKGDEQRRVVV